MDDDVGEGEDGEGPAVDDEKLPKYPRGMLKLEVTDGLRVMKAMEYERLQGMQLGETCLGSKVSQTSIMAYLSNGATPTTALT